MAQVTQSPLTAHHKGTRHFFNQLHQATEPFALLILFFDLI
jgi:hypothetical protein